MNDFMEGHSSVPTLKEQRIESFNFELNENREPISSALKSFLNTIDDLFDGPIFEEHKALLQELFESKQNISYKIVILKPKGL